MGAYSPKNMYQPAVGPDTKGYSEAITAVGGAAAGAIKEQMSQRSAAKAADAEYDMMQKMYPEAAQFIDPDKFAAASLSQKQSMLGMSKGYLMQQAEEKDRAAKQAAMEQRMKLASQITPIQTKDGGTIYMTGDGRVAYTDKPEKPPADISMKDLGGGYRAVEKGNQFQLIRPEQQATPSLAEMKTADGATLYVDKNGQVGYKSVPEKEFTMKDLGNGMIAVPSGWKVINKNALESGGQQPADPFADYFTDPAAQP